MISRRDLLIQTGAFLLSPSLPKTQTLRLTVITDLHYGFATDAMTRLQDFVAATRANPRIDAALQLGDFCHSDGTARACLDEFNKITVPKLHVLGNHDMDRNDKSSAIEAWGMPDRFYAKSIKGWRILVLDLNHYQKEGRLVSYADGNYFTSGTQHNFADPEQLDWLRAELKSSKEPVIILSHQPIGFAPFDAAQNQVLDIIENEGQGKVAACLSGHMHVDRLERVNRVPCLCVNSASYFWADGMNPYSKPLYAFIEISPAGWMTVSGREGAFIKAPPESSVNVSGRSASIKNRTVLTTLS